MDIQQILKEVEAKFGMKLDAGQVQNMLKGVDLSKLSMNDIMAKLSATGLVGDLDGDGKVESLSEELKGKAAQMFGGLGKMFGK